MNLSENLETMVNILTSDLEKFDTQLQSFLSGSQKLDNLLSFLNKPMGDRGGLEYNQTDHNLANVFQDYFCPYHQLTQVYCKPVNQEKWYLMIEAYLTTYLQPAQKSILAIIRFGIVLSIVISQDTHGLSVTKFLNRNRSQNISSQVNFLNNQVSYLIELMTQFRINSTSRKVRVKQSDLYGHRDALNGDVDIIALQREDFFYLNEQVSRYVMCIFIQSILSHAYSFLLCSM